MPLVRAYVVEDPESTVVKAGLIDGLIEGIHKAAEEVIPSAFNSAEGPLTSGQIQFIALPISHGNFGADVLIEVEAYNFPDRQKDIDQRCREIQSALQRVMLGYTFAVWGKLLEAGLAPGNTPVRDQQNDMSMEAAIQRAHEALDPPFRHASYRK